MIKFTRNNARIRLLIISLGVALLTGCAVRERQVSRPTITETSDWKLVESCMNQGCLPRVDDLVSKDLRIQIRLENNLTARTFLFSLVFSTLEPSTFLFEPSAVNVRLFPGDRLPAKAFPCPRTMNTLEFLRAVPALREPLRLEQWTCVRFFVDAPPPLVTENFSLFLAGITQAGARVDIPEIVFRPRIVQEHKPFGLFQ